jgi:hypothetical protein
VIVGRTMEFALDLGWKLMVVPRGASFTGTAPAGAGRSWSARYGFVGVSALDRPSVTDGINEAGLYAGLLYLPGYACYQDAAGAAAEDLVSPSSAAPRKAPSPPIRTYPLPSDCSFLPLQLGGASSTNGQMGGVVSRHDAPGW